MQRPTSTLILTLATLLVACQSSPPSAGLPAPTGGLGGAVAGGPSQVVAGGAGNLGAGAPTPAPAPLGQALQFVGFTEQQGKVLAGAQVEVFRLDTNALVATTTSLDDGSFVVSLGPELPPTMPIKIVAKQGTTALGAVVAGGPLAVVAGGAGNIVAGGAGNIVAGGAGNVVAGGAGNIVAGGAGNVVAGGAGNIVAGGAGNIVAGGAGNLAGALPATSLASLTKAGQIVAGGAGNFQSGQVLSGGAGHVLVAAPSGLKAAGIVAGGAGNIVAGGAGNIVAGGAGNIVAGGAGNLVAGGAGNLVAGGAGTLTAGAAGSYLSTPRRLLQSGAPLAAVKLSTASTAAVLILEKRVRAYAQASGQTFIQAAAMVADAVFEGLTGFLATSPTLQGDEAAQALVTRALAEGQPQLPPTVARLVGGGEGGLDATIVDAASRLALVVLGTATATNNRPSSELLGGLEVGNQSLPPVELPSFVGQNPTGGNSTPPPGGSSSSSSNSTVVAPSPLSPGQNPLSFPSGGIQGLGNPGLAGPGPVPSSFPTQLLGFTTAPQLAPAVYQAAAFVLGNQLFIAGGGTATATATTQVWRSTLDAQGNPGSFIALSPLPVARSGMAFAMKGNLAFLIGGRDGSGLPQSSILVADLSLSDPSFAPIAGGGSLIEGLEGASAVVTGPNAIVVVGGKNASQTTKRVHSINLGTNPPTVTHHGLLNGSALLTQGLAFAQAYVRPAANFCVELVGGFDGASLHPNLIQVFLDPNGFPLATASIVNANALDISFEASMRQAKAAVWQDPITSDVVMVGGLPSATATQGGQSVLLRRWQGPSTFLPVEDLGSTTSTRLTQGRLGAALVRRGQQLLVVGGKGTTAQVPLATVEVGTLQ